MTAPGNAEQAAQIAARLLRRSLPGASSAVRVECERAARVACGIWRRWHVGPWQWKRKHVRWYLEYRTQKYSAWTRYRYWLTVERVLRATGKFKDWRPGLNGPWSTPLNPEQNWQAVREQRSTWVRRISR